MTIPLGNGGLVSESETMLDYFAARAGWAPDWFEPLEGDGVRLVHFTLEQQIARQTRWCFAYGTAMLRQRGMGVDPRELLRRFAANRGRIVFGQGIETVLLLDDNDNADDARRAMERDLALFERAGFNADTYEEPSSDAIMDALLKIQAIVEKGGPTDAGWALIHGLAAGALR